MTQCPSQLNNANDSAWLISGGDNPSDGSEPHHARSIQEVHSGVSDPTRQNYQPAQIHSAGSEQVRQGGCAMYWQRNVV